MKDIVPLAFQMHLDGYHTSVCGMLKITPVKVDKDTAETIPQPPIGLSGLPRDVVIGGVTYSAARGLETTAHVSSSTTGVDNAEAKMAYATAEDMGLTSEQVQAGYLDNALYELFLVNHKDLGSPAFLYSAGKIGEIATVHSQIGVLELRSWTQLWKEHSLCDSRSKTCRATYGDQLDCFAEVVWAAADVSAADVDEPDRIFFTAAPVTSRGWIHWTSGRNLGLTSDIATVDSGAVILRRPLPYVVEVDDTFEWAMTCDYTREVCFTLGRILEFQGEPDVPESDGKAAQSPQVT